MEPKKTDRPRTRPIAVRLPEQVIEQLDQYAAQLAGAGPRMVTRSWLIREALAVFLAGSDERPAVPIREQESEE
jgi:hypothetical protein